MNILVLAAGYATRLYPLTLNKAKPLLDVAGKPMLEWVLDNLAPIPDIGTVYIVTNNKFAADFQAWADGYNAKGAQLQFKIVNDGSTNDQDKLGAIGDINLVVHKEGLDKDGLLVVAGDNLFSESLEKFAEFAKEHRSHAGHLRRGRPGADQEIQQPDARRRGPHHGLRGKARPPHEHEHGHRAVLLRGVHGEDCSTLTSRKATTPTSRAGSSSGSTRAWACTRSRSPAPGSTSAARKRWKRRTGFSPNSPGNAHARL